jgi:hypothetical protein
MIISIALMVVKIPLTGTVMITTDREIDLRDGRTIA